MKSLLFVVLVSLALAVFAHAPEDVVPGIVELNADNFDKHVDSTKFALVEFYAPWCGHCKNLAPEMAKLGEMLEKQKPNVVVGKVNCDAHSAVCQRFGVRGYPTIKFFAKKMDPEDYQGGRTADDFVEFLNRRAGTYIKSDKPPSAVLALTPSTFDSVVMDASKNVLVEFYAPWCGHCKKLEPDYEKVANAFRLQKNVVVAKVDADKHKDLAEKFGVQGFPTIKFFPAGQSKKTAEEYNGGRSPDDFLKFLNDKGNAHRTLSGVLDEKAGKVYTLDRVVSDFLKASAEEKKALIEKADKLVADLKGEEKESGEYYAKSLKKVLENPEYATKEHARLTRILSDVSKVSDEKLDMMKIRQNILSSFK